MTSPIEHLWYHGFGVFAPWRWLLGSRAGHSGRHGAETWACESAGLQRAFFDAKDSRESCFPGLIRGGHVLPCGVGLYPRRARHVSRGPAEWISAAPGQVRS